jgi:hypothetical protein
MPRRTHRHRLPAGPWNPSGACSPRILRPTSWRFRSCPAPTDVVSPLGHESPPVWRLRRLAAPSDKDHPSFQTSTGPLLLRSIGPQKEFVCKIQMWSFFLIPLMLICVGCVEATSAMICSATGCSPTCHSSPKLAPRLVWLVRYFFKCSYDSSSAITNNYVLE